MPTVNNMVMCTLICVKRVDLMLNILTKHEKEKKWKRHEKILTGIGYVYYRDSNDSIMDVCIYTNSPNCTHEICAVFVINYNSRKLFFSKKRKCWQMLVYIITVIKFFCH